MVRVLVALCLVCAVAGRASAGLRCIREPATVFWNGMVDVHADGRWHWAEDGQASVRAGKLSRAALDRFTAYAESGASEAKVLRCLDALTRDEDGRKAKRACKLPKRAAQAQ